VRLLSGGGGAAGPVVGLRSWTPIDSVVATQRLASKALLDFDIVDQFKRSVDVRARPDGIVCGSCALW
jgi:hypothetical protein